MPLVGEVINHNLVFKFGAGTSRGILREKASYYVKIFDTAKPKVFGVGECSPLKGLSIDDRQDYALKLLEFIHLISSYDKPHDQVGIFQTARNIAGLEFPSLRFGIEVALLDLLNNGNRIIFKNRFSEGLEPIAINGLIWMGSPDFMLGQINEKIEEGFNCIKIKVGAMDFDSECELISKIRDKYSPEEIEIRVDANGAFSPEEAVDKLQRLKKFKLHSIEQPIPPGNIKAMKDLCKLSPIPVALDEELIGVKTLEEKRELLKAVNPPYIILKPTLLGGFEETEEWIHLAQECNIGWWITSALESNIGLNAISQFAANYKLVMPQGLGTGKLYVNNVPSPLHISEGKIRYDTNINWKLDSVGIK